MRSRFPATSRLPALPLVLFVIGASIAPGADPTDARAAPTPEQIRFFETKIRPLLADRCYDCHGADLQESELRLDSLQRMLDGGKAGPAIRPGKPEGSLLITAVGYRDNDLRMPPDEKLSDLEIAALTKWVELGAPHPDSGNVRRPSKTKTIDIAEGRKHWSFRPPVAPEVPTVKKADRVRTPVDAFILARLQEQGLRPVAPADKRTLIRRATFDLIGLPPTPDEIDAFLADDAPGAFARLVDRLLESPHYGERWGRHWLDVARYADSNGLDENVAHGNAWRYRDWVVQSFNADKPYDEFLVEQLAGDLLDGGNDVALRNERLIATGFLALGPKVLAEVDERKMEMDIVDEQLDTIGRSLMGLTLGCARCHSHKFDPIGQDDYYGLAGIFKSTRVMENFKKVARWHENSIATPADLARKQAHDEKVAAKQSEIDELVAAAEKALQADLGAGAALPEKPEEQYPDETKAALKQLRGELAELKNSAPVMPTAMGAADGNLADVAIHIRGSHLTLGDTVHRRFPRVLAGDEQPEIPSTRSGRLAFARWLTAADHPLTARVMVNRVWRWHFGKGLVPTPDNFGTQGTPPTHPELLDWLAVHFVEERWSLKALHRTIMLSSTYRLAGNDDERNAAVDPQNALYWRRDVRRLEAEAIRDSLLAVSGTLDRTMGGNLLHVGNREYLFNHTSEDGTNYDTRRRSIYIPVIRNHLYDMFSLFDYADASVINGNRTTSTVAPQALFLMNAELMTDVTAALGDGLLAGDAADADRIERLYQKAYGRPPHDHEVERALRFVTDFAGALEASEPDAAAARREAWRNLCQAVVSSNEFLYVR